MNTLVKPDLRERVLERGISYPSDEELIMLIIGSGSKDERVEELSEKILRVTDCFSSEKLVPELLKIKGVGHSKALAVAAAIEMGRRRNCHLEAKIRCPKDIIPYLQTYAIKSQEHFIAVCLSGAHEIISINVISIGSGNHALVSPREIFSDAIKKHAAAIIICHNHPSGNCTPSNDDIKTTQRILEASSILGITLLDHIIVSRNSYYSFEENNRLKISS